MSCKGCPGTQVQVGEEQAGFARQYAIQQATELSRRVNLCKKKCEQWGGYWTCTKFETSEAFRKAIRTGHCPEGNW